MSTDADPAALCNQLGQRWATAETSYKYFASCRHTHPAADALLQLMRDTGLQPADIETVTAHVHQGAMDVLGAVNKPETVHQAKFSMGTVLGLIAWHGHVGLAEFDQYALSDTRVHDFRERVVMTLDPEIDAAYPRRWMGRVTVTRRDGQTLERRIEEPRGDPGNPLSRQDLEAKFRQLAAYAQGATPAEAERLIELVWGLDERPLPSRWL